MDQQIGKKWKPHNGAQMAFHSSVADEVFYGGAAGGGKTISLLMEALRYVHKPLYRALLLRRTMPELQRSLIPLAHEYLHSCAIWNGATHTYTFPSGAVIEFGHCQNETDVYRYDSAAYDYIAFDELTTFSFFIYNYISARSRGADVTIPKRIRSASNPGRVGNSWVKRRFIDNKEPYKIYKDDKSGLTLQFIPARVYDNPTLLVNNPQYIQRLKALAEPYRSAMLNGDWNIFIGQYFPEFTPEKDGKPYHVIPSYKINTDFAIYRSMDWGFSAPCAVLWHMIVPLDGFNRMITFAEEYRTQTNPKDWAKIIMDREKAMGIDSDKVIGVADPSADSKCADGGPSVMAQILEASNFKVRFAKGNNDRLNGWLEVRKWLAPAPDGLPHWQICGSCVNMVRTLPEAVHDENKTEDLDTMGEEHCLDSFRYQCMLAPSPAKKVPDPEPRDRMEARRQEHFKQLEVKRELVDIEA